MKKYSINLLLLALSISLSLIVGECILRALFNPVDYLQPSLVYDEQLGALTVKPNSAGHDSWGYRNTAVPTAVDIVTIGDSQTYGISASRANSWPAQLHKKTGRTVYNLSLGGYGPVQYYLLLKDKAISLNPSLVIVGLYYGNDLNDAYRAVYEKDKWKFLRRPDLIPETQMQSVEEVEEEVVLSNYRLMGSLRHVLSQNSILYRMITLSFGNTFRFLEMQYIRKDKHEDITILNTMGSAIGTGFTPRRRLMGLNINDARIREGEKHDYLRGVPGNFIKLEDTIRRLLGLREKYANLYVELGTVVSKNNIKDIEEVATYVHSLGIESYRNEIAEERTEFHNIGDGITPSAEEYRDVMDTFAKKIRENIKQKRAFTKMTESFRLVYYDLAYEIVKRKTQVIPCYGGISNVHLNYNGELWPCCVLGYDQPLGNFRDHDYNFDRVMATEQARKVLKHIKDKKCYCPLANQWYSNILINFRTMSRVARNMVRFLAS